jgi:hypothetical protein
MTKTPGALRTETQSVESDAAVASVVAVLGCGGHRNEIATWQLTVYGSSKRPLGRRGPVPIQQFDPLDACSSPAAQTVRLQSFRYALCTRRRARAARKLWMLPHTDVLSQTRDWFFELS